MTEAEKRIREALAAGPTPGQWFHCQPFHRVEKMRTIHGTVPAQRVDFVATEPSPPHRRVVIPMEGRESNVRSEDMAFIAACSPENITALLADQAALRAEVEALRNLLHRAGNALVCDGEVMSESDDEWTRSHACGRCDDYVDRGWPIRTEIRAALAAKDAEAR